MKKANQGFRVKQLRIVLGFENQRSFAEFLGCPTGGLGRIETSDRLTKYQLRQIAKIKELGGNIGYVTNEDEPLLLSDKLKFKKIVELATELNMKLAKLNMLILDIVEHEIKNRRDGK